MKPLLHSRRERGIYTVTDAQRPKSEDIAHRQRRYLISMGLRVIALPLAVFFFHGVWMFIAAAVALVVPAFAVIYANGGREPAHPVRLDSFEGSGQTPPGEPDHEDPVALSGSVSGDGRHRSGEAREPGGGPSGLSGGSPADGP